MSTWDQPKRLRRPGRGLKIEEESANIQYPISNCQFSKSPHTQKFGQAHIDRIVNTSQGLRFEAKTCVFDSELIPNSIIHPI